MRVIASTARDLERVGQILYRQGSYTQATEHLRHCLDHFECLLNDLFFQPIKRNSFFREIE